MSEIFEWGSGRFDEGTAKQICANITKCLSEPTVYKSIPARNESILSLPVKLRTIGKAGNGYRTEKILPMDFVVATARVGKKGNVIIGLRPRAPHDWTQAEVDLADFELGFGKYAFAELKKLAYRDGVAASPPVIPDAQSLLIAEEMGENYGSW